jgi:hypothetical protein
MNAPQDNEKKLEDFIKLLENIKQEIELNTEIYNTIIQAYNDYFSGSVKPEDLLTINTDINSLEEYDECKQGNIQQCLNKITRK